MKRPVTALVTAAAGDLGQALIKALRLCRPPIVLHGADLEPGSHAASFVAAYHALPPAGDRRYLSAVDELCREIAADVVVPASEPEILALRGAPLPGGTPVVSQPGAWLDRYTDKLAVMEFLAGKVAMARFADGTDAGAVGRLVSRGGFPLVVKPRRSSGSRCLHRVQSEGELATALAATPLPLVQGYLDDSGGEFSVGVFRCPGVETAIAFRRRLGAATGLSWEAEVAQDPRVIDYALGVARAMGAQGSVNVQVRLTTSGPRLLEVNSRFSSLVAARAFAGFRDAEWSVLIALGREVPVPPAEYRHLRFRRYFHEVIDTGTGFGAVAEWSPRVLPEVEPP